jgi:hypothetical protein
MANSSDDNSSVKSDGNVIWPRFGRVFFRNRPRSGVLVCRGSDCNGICTGYIVHQLLPIRVRSLLDTKLSPIAGKFAGGLVAEEVLQRENISMSRLEHMKDLWDRARTDLDLSALEKATAIWRSSAEAEKLELESSNLKRAGRSESVRFWVPVLASIITSAALVGTLLFQIRQFKENVRLQTEATEDTQYREMLKEIENPQMVHGAVGIPFLTTFLESPRYGGQARKVAINMLQGIAIYDSFRSLFDPIANKTDWSNYRDIVRLDGLIYEEWSHWDGDVDRMGKEEKELPKQAKSGASVSVGRSLPPGGAPVPFGPGRQLSLSQVRDITEQKRRALVHCEDFLITFLKKDRPRGLILDLSGALPVYLGGEDLSGFDLRGAILTDVVFDRSKLEGANLSDVSQFDDSGWDSVAWWRAAAISPPLLAYLKKNFQYSSDAKYDPPATLEDYDKEVVRLEAAGAHR